MGGGEPPCTSVVLNGVIGRIECSETLLCIKKA